MSSAFEEKLAILDLFARYNFSIDKHDVNAWVSCFADDAVYDSPLGQAQGKEMLTKVISGLFASGNVSGKRHCEGQATITVDGDRATAYSYYFIIEAVKAPGIVASGTYEDELRKVDGIWKFQRRRQTTDPSWKGF